MKSFWMTALCLCTLLLGCSAETRPTEVTILAASSLTNLFEAYEDEFELMYPEIDLVLSFAGSQQLKQQIQGGLSADLFAPAHPDYFTMVDPNSITPFATNQLVFATHPSLNIFSTAEQLLQSGYKLGIGAETVPIGRYSRVWLQQLGIEASYMGNVVTEELNVRQLRTKIELGELDGGIVYQSDLSESLATLYAPKYTGETIQYSIAMIEDSIYKEESNLFLEYISSENGQKILQKFRFTPLK